MIDINDLRRAAESFVRRDALVRYEAWLEDRAPASLQPEPDAAADAFTPEALATVRQAAGAEPEAGPRRVLVLLHRGLLSGALEREVGPALARLSAAATAHMSFLRGSPSRPDEGEAAWRSVDDAAEREQLHQALLQAWSGSTGPYLEVVRTLHGGAARLGLYGPDDLMRTLARVEPAELRTAASTLLGETDELLTEVLQLASRVHGVPPLPAHLPRLFHVPEMEHRFTAERLLPVAGSLLEGMGIQLLHEQGLQVQSDPVSGWRPSRAFPINLPREVRLVIHRSSGLQAARMHMLALGQALHWLHTEPGPFPVRWPFGHRGISDAFGLLLAGLLTSTAVLVQRGLPLEVADALARATRRAELLHLRTNAALVATTPCGPELSDTPLEAYAAAIGRARGLPVAEPEARAWPIRIEATYAAETLQSWALAAALREQLVVRLGEAWWQSPDSGELLRSWMRQGQRLSPAELMAHLAGEDPADSPPLKVEPLLREVRRDLP